MVSYAGSATGYGDALFLYADARGSIVYRSDRNATTSAINTYDIYGIPGTTNAGRFQYTGQVWLPELGMYYYKARIYSPTLGRFLQTDPIGYEDNVNLYAYVGNDPVNGVDPTGMTAEVTKITERNLPNTSSRAGGQASSGSYMVSTEWLGVVGASSSAASEDSGSSQHGGVLGAFERAGKKIRELATEAQKRYRGLKNITAAEALWAYLEMNSRDYDELGKTLYAEHPSLTAISYFSALSLITGGEIRKIRTGQGPGVVLTVAQGYFVTLRVRSNHGTPALDFNDKLAGRLRRFHISNDPSHFADR